MEELPGSASVGDAGDGYAKLTAAVVQPAIQVGVFGQNVGEEYDDSVGAVWRGDALVGGPASGSTEYWTACR
ncbi:hypothetical protein ACQEUX_11980 [Micromonospora sp. CA-259024]|uniref:hypothetical protein n=1 Tax=Micromonospora sp. CA-259024 TaxID=3239965 RepID=UPI003D94C328